MRPNTLSSPHPISRALQPRSVPWRAAAVGGLLGATWLLATLPWPLALALALAGPGIVLLARRPGLAWVALGALLPLAATAKWGPVSLADGGVAMAVALWLADGARRRSLRVTWHPLLTPLTFYVAAQLLSTPGALNLGEAMQEVVKWIEFGAVLAVAGSSLRPQQRVWLVYGLLAGGTAQGLLGIYQFLNRIGPEWFVVLGRFMRASGSFGQPNPYAGYLGLTLPVAISLSLYFLTTRSTTESHGLGKWRWRSLQLGLTGAAVGIMGAGLLASWSRGGWLGAAIGIGLTISLQSRRVASMALLMALVIFGGLAVGSVQADLLPAPIAARLADLPAYFGLAQGGLDAVLEQPLTTANFSVQERIAHWAAALKMWQMRPWLGVGPGNYATIYPQVQAMGWDEALGHAHNIYLNVLGETGAVGLVAYFLFWLSATVWAARRWWLAENGWQRAVAAGVLGVLAHLAVHNIFDNLFVQGVYLHLALWLAALGGPRVSTTGAIGSHGVPFGIRDR